MRVFLDVMTIQENGDCVSALNNLIDADLFEDLNKMLNHLVSNYANIVNLRQLDEEDKEKGDLYFEVYVKKVR